MLANVRTQIEQLNGNISLKRAEMGTDLVDHLTPEERNLLSRLNPEIKEMKENLMECRTKLVEVGMNLVRTIFLSRICYFIC